MITKSIRRKSRVRNNNNKTNFSRKRQNSKNKKKISRQNKKSLSKKKKISKKKKKIMRGGAGPSKETQSPPPPPTSPPPPPPPPLTKEQQKQSDIKKMCETDNISSKYKFVSLLGKGSFGRVIKAKNKSVQHSYVAIKEIIMIKDTDTDTDISDIISEINILTELLTKINERKVGSDKVMKYHECYCDVKNNKFYIVTELIKGTQLSRLQSNYSNNINIIKNIMKQILKGLEFLHNNYITHLDLKPEIIMIEPKTRAIKIVDFGISCLQNKTLENCEYPSGTILYMHPSLIELYINQKSTRDRLKDLGMKNDELFHIYSHYLYIHYDYWALGQIIFSFLNPKKFFSINKMHKKSIKQLESKLKNQLEYFNNIHLFLIKEIEELKKKEFKNKEKISILTLLEPIINPKSLSPPEDNTIVKLMELNDLYLKKFKKIVN